MVKAFQKKMAEAPPLQRGPHLSWAFIGSCSKLINCLAELKPQLQCKYLLVRIPQRDTSDSQWLGGLPNASLKGNFIALRRKGSGILVQIYKSIFSKTNNRTARKTCTTGGVGRRVQQTRKGKPGRTEATLKFFLAKPVPPHISALPDVVYLSCNGTVLLDVCS